MEYKTNTKTNASRKSPKKRRKTWIRMTTAKDASDSMLLLRGASACETTVTTTTPTAHTGEMWLLTCLLLFLCAFYWVWMPSIWKLQLSASRNPMPCLCFVTSWLFCLGIHFFLVVPHFFPFSKSKLHHTFREIYTIRITEGISMFHSDHKNICCYECWCQMLHFFEHTDADIGQ